MNQSTMFVGVAKRVITPELGSELAGFDARKGVATAVHDDLYVRAVVFDASGETVVLLTLDLIGISQKTTDAVREAVYASTGIAKRNVILCATHTHCGPVTIKHFFNGNQPKDETYLKLLKAKTIDAIEEAFANRTPARLRSGLVKVKGVAVNRRTESGQPIDDLAGVLAVESPEGKLRAVVVSYACHPTVLGPNTLDVTRDFPHYLDIELTKQLGDDVTVLYFNGTEGDLSIGHKSFLSAVGVIADFRTYAKAEEIGSRLAKAVLAGLPQLIVEKSEVVSTHITVSLPLKSYEPYPVMQQKTIDAKQLLDAESATVPEGAETPFDVILKRQNYLFARIEEYYASLLAEQPDMKTLDVEVSVVRLGKTALLFVPGEIFVEIGLAIRSRSPFAKTILFGLANDYIGYVPTIEQAKLSGYEVVASRVTPEASLVLENDSVKALESAFRAKG
ncbi:MAG TPA: neutral/alkaline non-lysosomal ceramidase N-terminal domain-containing protein [Edaphobacter sp.]|nr:neutral/alkaline non-lysosomal ceramidase N-terminal domain-containing protein [Edaphobacter sp.]